MDERAYGPDGRGQQCEQTKEEGAKARGDEKGNDGGRRPRANEDPYRRDARQDDGDHPSQEAEHTEA